MGRNEEPDFLVSFTDYLTDEEKSTGTINGYTADVKDFMSFVRKDIKMVKRTDVSAFKDHLRQRKLSTLSINRKMVSLKQFIDFTNERYELGITARVKQEKVQKQYSLKDEELLTQPDYERLMIAIEDADDIRTKALFEAMYYSGMRISEVLQLRTDHVLKGSRVIEDIKGKGLKFRDIYISDKLLTTLREYLKVRRQPFSSTTKDLFVGERGVLTRQTAHYLMMVEEAMKGLTDVEAVFLKLAWFFEAPEQESFNIGLLYHHLDNEWLEFALVLLTQFFQKDTYLIQKPTYSILRETPDPYFNQKQFADFLSEHGLNYDKRKLNVYYSRGKLPKADVELAGTPYWSKSTVEEFCEQEKERLKMN